MRLNNVNLIFRKELRDVLRDRRTLVATFVLPLILYPGLIIGFAQVTAVQQGRQAQEVYQVAVIGGEAAPDLVAAISPESDRLEVVPRPGDAGAALREGRVQLVVVVPPDFRTRLQADTTAELRVRYDQSNERSARALQRFSAVVARYRETVLKERLARLEPPRVEAFVEPVRLEPHDVAQPTQVLLMLASGVLVFLAVAMALTGAFYPAIDTCAGEKERGTIETLLVSPASRTEIVFGKYLLVLVMSLATAVLNLLSMALTVFAMVRMRGSMDATPGPLGVHELFQALPSLVWVFVLLIPVAAFFSAMALALAAFARSSKEAQYYMLPLYVIALPLAGLGAIPGVNLSLLLDLVPVAGAAVVFRHLLAGREGVAPHAVLVFVANFAYAAVAVQWTASLFKREEVLFREAEEFDWRFWRWVSFRSPDGRPTLAHVILAFGAALFLVFYGATLVAGIRHLTAALVFQQVIAVAGPPVAIVALFRLQWRRTFRLRLAGAGALALAVPLALGAHVLNAELAYLVQGDIPLPPGFEEALKGLLTGPGGIWAAFVAIAVVPAVAEELMFRGFVLSGLRTRMGTAKAVAASALLFGLFHLNFAQLVFAALSGLVLGAVAVRTRSLLAPILFHLTNNAMGVLIMAVTQAPARAEAEGGLAEGLRRALLAHGGAHYAPRTVAVAAVLFLGSLWLMWRATRRREAGKTPARQGV